MSLQQWQPVDDAAWRAALQVTRAQAGWLSALERRMLTPRRSLSFAGLANAGPYAERRWSTTAASVGSGGGGRRRRSASAIAAADESARNWTTAKTLSRRASVTSAASDALGTLHSASIRDFLKKL